MRPRLCQPALVFVCASGIFSLASCVDPFALDKSPQGGGVGGQAVSNVGSGGASVAGIGGRTGTGGAVGAGGTVGTGGAVGTGGTTQGSGGTNVDAGATDAPVVLPAPVQPPEPFPTVNSVSSGSSDSGWRQVDVSLESG